MNEYRVKIRGAREVVVLAETETEAFNEAFDLMEWDCEIGLLAEGIMVECEDDGADEPW